MGTVRFLLKKPSFWCIALGAAFRSFVSYAQASFVAAFFFRVHGQALEVLGHAVALKPASFLGFSLGLISGIGGSLGIWLGGKLADNLGKRDLRAYGAIPALSTLVAAPFSMATYLASDPKIAFGFFFVSILLGSFWFGPVHATGQSVVRPEMRATSAALILLILNLIGLGLGPLSVGLLSDGLAAGASLGAAEGLRWALVVSNLIAIPSAWLFWRARRTLRHDFEC